MSRIDPDEVAEIIRNDVPDERIRDRLAASFKTAFGIDLRVDPDPAD